jgi:Fe2+ transport system protein FeoA
MKQCINLVNARVGEVYRIAQLDGGCAMRNRLLGMGMIPGATMTVVSILGRGPGGVQVSVSRKIQVQ